MASAAGDVAMAASSILFLRREPTPFLTWMLRECKVKEDEDEIAGSGLVEAPHAIRFFGPPCVDPTCIGSEESIKSPVVTGNSGFLPIVNGVAG